MEANFDIAIVAPFPAAVREGWMSRIGCIDSVLSSCPRLYVHFSTEHTVERDGKVIQHGPHTSEIRLNHTEKTHRRMFDDIVARARSVYVHTVHLAEYVMDWFPSGTFIVDIHGIGPEEEIMLGRPELAHKYAVVEQTVLKQAKAAVVVSNAMVRHFRTKYPEITPQFLHVPIYEEYNGASAEGRLDGDSLPVSAVYVGGIQVWQNLDGMLRLAQDCQDFARFAFLSHDHAIIRQRAEQLCPNAQLHLGFCEKTDLPRMYGQYQFGLVLRDDSPVNRVSCPTKLSEYLRFGLIPVIRFPDLGDFRDYGYCYIQEDEFKDGFFPDARTRIWMRQTNLAAMDSLMQTFQRSARLLREYIVS